ncbi:MAG: 3-phosphoshikimate 1-carboxyvinyltransferase [Clostridia bacterium]|nr:3-phosphoshikimate 1-carboxyvinyltransferase [Clostridia bacterium]
MSSIILTAPVSEGSVTAVSAKADVQRALIAAALSEGRTDISCLHPGKNILATADCLRALGAAVRRDKSGFTVTSPVRPGGFAELNAGESATTLRFLLPIIAALGGFAVLDGGPQLKNQPLLPLIESLREHGAVIPDEALPLSVQGQLSEGTYVIPGNSSSQFISGLMFALPLLGKKSKIRLSTPLKVTAYIDMTIHTLSAFHVWWKRTADGYEMLPDSAYRTPGRYETAGDWSCAAPFLAAAAMRGRVEMGELTLSTKQAEKKILPLLAEAGAAINMVGQHVTVEHVTDLCPFDADLGECPDLAPTLAVLACAARGDSYLTGARHYKLKDMDRLEAVAEMLRSLGAEIENLPDGLLVHGTGRLRGGAVNAHGDHRIVMAAAQARSITSGDVTVAGADAVTKAYPTFFDDYKALGGRLLETPGD